MQRLEPSVDAGPRDAKRLADATATNLEVLGQPQDAEPQCRLVRSSYSTLAEPSLQHLDMSVPQRQGISQEEDPRFEVSEPPVVCASSRLFETELTSPPSPLGVEEHRLQRQGHS